jgi:plasmid stabilization system protein ParE
VNLAVETSDVAGADIEAAFLRLSRQDPEFAGRWLEGLNRMIAALDTFPTRHARVSESDTCGREVRRMLYRNGRTVYRVFFTLLDADGDGDPDTVRVLRVRHGAQRPLGQPDAEAE